MTATFEAVEDDEGNYLLDENNEVRYRTIEDEGGDTPMMEIGKCSPL